MTLFKELRSTYMLRKFVAVVLVVINVCCGATESFSYEFIDGTTQNVNSGDTTNTSILMNGGTQNVYSGGTAKYTTIYTGSVQNVYTGGTFKGTTISTGGVQNIYAGAIDISLDSSTATIISGGTQNILSGYTLDTTATFLTFTSGTQNVYGTANNVTLASGTTQNVEDGGTTNGTIVSGGAQHVLSGGTATGTTLNSGSQAIDGTATGTIINGGTQYIGSGGKATGTTINSGTQTIYSGGTADATTIAGGIQAVYGTATNTTIIGGTQTISSGGTADTTIINGGAQHVLSGGTATGTTLNSGSQAIFGTATNTTIAGGTQNVSGTATNTIINSGTQNVQSGGSANTTTINGGVQNVLAGGSATNTTIAGGSQNVSGTATNTIINSGTQNVNSGGSANTTTINGGVQNVLAGGSATNTTIAGGTMNVSGTATSTTINAGAMNIQSGGTADTTTINGGTQNVLAGGTATNSTIRSGGTMNVSGTAGSVTMLAGGTLVINHGGVLTDPSLENPGTLTFNTTGGSSANGFTVTDGAGSGKTTVVGSGSVTLTGDITQGQGIVVAGGSLTLQSNTLTVSGAPSVTLDAGANQATAALNGVTLDMASGQDVFKVLGSTNSGNALNLTDMTVDATSPGSGTLLRVTGGSSVAFTAGNSTLTGDIAFDSGSSGRISLAASSTLTGTVTGGPNMSIDSDSRWTMTGDASIGNLNLAGNLVFRDDGTPFTPKTLTVTSITGGQGLSGGTITLNTVLGDSASPTDMIVVNGGTVTGTTKLFINNVGGLGASTAGTSGILIVDAINGAQTAASLVNPGFYLSNGPLNVGAYTYSLRPGDQYGQGQDWYLTTDYVSPMTFVSASSSTSSSSTSTASSSSSASSSGSSGSAGTQYAGGPILLGGGGVNTVTLSGVTIDASSLGGQAGALITMSGATSAANTVSFNNVTASVGSDGGRLISGTSGSNFTFTASGSTLTGDIIVDDSSHGQVHLANNTNLTGMIDPVDLSIDASSKWVMTGDSVLGNLTLAGSIVSQTPTDAFTPKTLTVTNLTGQGGTITLNTYLGCDNSPSDKIIVDGGTVTGTTKLSINNVGGLGAQTVGNGILVVEAINGADTTAQSTKDGFSLTAPVYAGSYMYYLRAGDVFGQGQDWYLSSTASGQGAARTAYRPDDALLASVIGLSHDLMQTTLGTLNVREGGAVEKASSGNGLTAWSRGLGSLLRKEGGGTVSPGYEGYTDGFQLGAELNRGHDSGDASALGVYGAMAYGYGRGWGDSAGARFTHVGQLDMTAYSVGLYGTYQWAGKGYVNAVAQGSILNGHAYGTSNVKVNGTGWAASLEGGYPFQLGASKFFLEPQAQGIYQQAHFDGVSYPSTHADLRGGNRLTLRGGARLKYDVVTESGVRWTPFVGLAVRRDQDDNAKVIMRTSSASTGLPTNFSGTSLELDAGLTVRVREQFNLYGQAGAFTAIDGKSSRGAQGSVGLKVSF